MKKLVGNAKYEIKDGDLCVYMPLKATGKYALVGSCHLSWFDTIKQKGMKGAIEQGLILN